MASEVIHLRPCNIWPQYNLTWFEGMFYCLECQAGFFQLSWDGEMMWHDTPVSDPGRPRELRHTQFTGRILVNGEHVPL